MSGCDRPQFFLVKPKQDHRPSDDKRCEQDYGHSPDNTRCPPISCNDSLRFTQWGIAISRVHTISFVYRHFLTFAQIQETRLSIAYILIFVKQALPTFICDHS